MLGGTMKRILRVAIATLIGLFAFGVAAPVAFAGSPHFVDDTVSATRSGNSITVSGKEAGLGDESQVHIVVSATAACINPGDKHPRAANKQSISAAGDFPVQNGKANFSLTLTATFQPSCSPPMTVVFTNVTVTDTTNGISENLGSF
jgi:hypothetical protein